MAERIDQVQPKLFIDGPAEYLSFKVAAELQKVKQFDRIFDEYIDGYKRMDYGMRNLPALRIYNNGYIKEFESWYINGDLVLDIIFPPSIKRDLLQRTSDVVSNALLQQFRRPKFLAALREQVPGLNELGKRFEVDKALAFEFETDLAPLTQIRANFRLNLEEWDRHLVETLRTKDDPFEEVLGSLDEVVSVIQGLRDGSEEVQVSVPSSQTTTLEG